MKPLLGRLLWGCADAGALNHIVVLKPNNPRSRSRDRSTICLLYCALSKNPTEKVEIKHRKMALRLCISTNERGSDQAIVSLTTGKKHYY